MSKQTKASRRAIDQRSMAIARSAVFEFLMLHCHHRMEILSHDKRKRHNRRNRMTQSNESVLLKAWALFRAAWRTVVSRSGVPLDLANGKNFGSCN